MYERKGQTLNELADELSAEGLSISAEQVLATAAEIESLKATVAQGVALLQRASDTMGRYRESSRALADALRQEMAERERREAVLSDYTKVLAKRDQLKAALEGFLESYLVLANSGDCGNWDPEEEDHVIAARAALKEL